MAHIPEGKMEMFRRTDLTLNAHLSLFVFIRKNNVMCYPRWCEQSFKPNGED